ncbi:MAG: ATP-binding cassette domain-containing protein [Planctomycetota bacterium]|jgi:putative ABC transport system ATP-binding protein
MSEAPIAIQNVNHHVGEGELRRQILFDISAEIRSGEIVILTGPSGSGKTTLLTLIGALRSAQDGSLRVLGHELRGADEGGLIRVRKEIGYVFQSHNLLDALTAAQNVEMSLKHEAGASAAEKRRRVRDVLESVGLGDHLDHHPSQLSGGERQRVAIARALVGRPKIVLADEPTASLDKKSGRDVVERLQRLAREQGVTVLLVTHDNRILDVADRIAALEDGRLSSFMTAVTESTEHLLGTLAHDLRKGELVKHVGEMTPDRFAGVLETVTREVQTFLDVVEMGQSDTFQSLLEQVLEAFASKVGEIVGAERIVLHLADEDRQELWSRAPEAARGVAPEARVPIERRRSACGSGRCAGHVAATGESINIADARRDPLFDPEADRDRGYRARSLLCVPIEDGRGEVFAVVELVNKSGGGAFTSADEARVREFTRSLGVLLEAWWHMSCRCTPYRPAEAAGEACGPGCGGTAPSEA